MLAQLLLLGNFLIAGSSVTSFDHLLNETMVTNEADHHSENTASIPCSYSWQCDEEAYCHSPGRCDRTAKNPCKDSKKDCMSSEQCDLSVAPHVCK